MSSSRIGIAVLVGAVAVGGLIVALTSGDPPGEPTPRAFNESARPPEDESILAPVEDTDLDEPPAPTATKPGKGKAKGHSKPPKPTKGKPTKGKHTKG